MAKADLEIARAWEEVNFWQELADHLKLPEPGIIKALEHARGRYENVFQKWNHVKKQ